MVEELAMLSVLTGMGIYFVKSTDLPKDLKERSLKNTSEMVSTVQKKRFAFPVENQNKNNSVIEKIKTNDQSEKLAIAQQKIAEEKSRLEKIKRSRELEIINLEINELTLKITSLEQEIKVNNDRNAQIQMEIEQYLMRLEELNNARLA